MSSEGIPTKFLLINVFEGRGIFNPSVKVDFEPVQYCRCRLWHAAPFVVALNSTGIVNQLQVVVEGIENPLLLGAADTAFKFSEVFCSKAFKLLGVDVGMIANGFF